MSSSKVVRNSEAIISIDASGFIFGSGISLQASKPMLVARKSGNLPGELIQEDFNLEYGKILYIYKRNYERNLDLML